MLDSTLGSEKFDYYQNFQINRDFVDHFFPYFILISDQMQIIDYGRLWSKLDTLTNTDHDFRIKRSSILLNKNTILENKHKRITLKHIKSGIVFMGEFISSVEQKYYLGIITPKVTSTEMASNLKAYASDFSGNDTTSDYALLFQTQKILLNDNIHLIGELVEKQQELQGFNESLEETILTRTKELEMLTAQSFQNARLASLGEMASGIAHEINNPLTIISSSTYVLQKMQENDELTNEKLVDVIGVIQKTVKRISKIINSVRTLSQNPTGEQFVPVNLRVILQEVFEIHIFKIRTKNIFLDLDLSSQEFDVRVLGNLIQLTQVFTNLIANSASAIENLKEKWIKISLKEDAEFYYVCFSDSGPGIPIAIQDKIFNPFFTTKSADQGTGLGLTISHKIVEKLGGSLAIDRSSKNTCFIVKLFKA